MKKFGLILLTLITMASVIGNSKIEAADKAVASYSTSRQNGASGQIYFWVEADVKPNVLNFYTKETPRSNYGEPRKLGTWQANPDRLYSYTVVYESASKTVVKAKGKLEDPTGKTWVDEHGRKMQGILLQQDELLSADGYSVWLYEGVKVAPTISLSAGEGWTSVRSKALGNHGLMKVVGNINDENGGWVSTAISVGNLQQVWTELAPHTLEFTFDSSALANGRYFPKATAFDEDGKRTDVTAPFELIVDDEKPTLPVIEVGL